MPGARWAALWNGNDLPRGPEAFWSVYAQLLSLVATARSEDGGPNFEPHKLTQLYEQVVQAARGSRWVWAMTFASSIEAIVKMLIPGDVAPTQAESEAIEALVRHIRSGPGDARMRESAIRAVRRTTQITVGRAIRDLRAATVISEEQVSAWQRLRNEVMHGNLISPYSSAEEDAELLALAAMMHALTRELIRRPIT